jgi:hypothetical protein
MLAASARPGRVDIHARIPMVTLDEQRALQLRNAEADERFWTQLRDMHAGTVEEHKELAHHSRGQDRG